jgi:Helix-turn-helix.
MGKKDERPMGRHIARWRRSRGLTQHQLSAISGVSRAMIGHMESGESAPSVRLLCAVVLAVRPKPSEVYAALLDEARFNAERFDAAQAEGSDDAR